ncbi:4-hydroxymandelate synthase [Actinopolyspora lacussalsi subsp. righensis]|uniref:4-hydroxymandelate synthase n=1 Tax=Actinopolyspora righensis TaxID=995060 RepID=A0A1I6XCV7_9ACTN|nr:4-hydroxyphenylpyruvate dioxygenase [Actinopolyspora righensis]SFT36120.1 4-hydroxymandelate synthase [Actinopolyspora righensis]
MSVSGKHAFDDLHVDHVEFYVDDLVKSVEGFSSGYGFTVYAKEDTPATGATAHSIGLGLNRIRLLLTQPLVDEHSAVGYLARHGDGVADIALRVADTTTAFREAVRRGATPVAEPVERDGVMTATIGAFGDVTHTFVERRADMGDPPQTGLWATSGFAYGPDSGINEIDHFAVCVHPGDLDDTVAFYRDVLDFDLIFTEHVEVGEQAMITKVVQSRSGKVTLTLIEPVATGVSGHIDEFLTNHGGPGVQHIAFNTNNIVRAVDIIRERDVEFLSTPDAYYSALPERVDLARYTVDELRARNILVDNDHDGQLFQIFTKSVHPRNTIFLEIIERLGARGFGSGNIKALYEAVERTREPGDSAA